MPQVTDQLDAMLRSVTQEVLETMVFVEAEPVDCAVCDTSGCIAARVMFHGNSSGEFRLRMSRELTHAIAAGFLGVDPEELNSETELQVACELTNVLCGAILSRLHPDSRIALDSPERTAAAWQSDFDLEQCFTTPEGMFGVAISIR